MRILVVNAFYPPLTTGSAHFSHDVARQYQAQGHEVLVLTAAPEGTDWTETIEGVPVRRLPARWIQPGTLSFNYSIPFVARLGAWGAVQRVVDEFRPDVIHQNGQFFDLTLLTSVVAWRRRIPRILTVHTPLTHTNALARAFISSVDRTVLRFSSGSAIHESSRSTASRWRCANGATGRRSMTSDSFLRRSSPIRSAEETHVASATFSGSMARRWCCPSAM